MNYLSSSAGPIEWQERIIPRQQLDTSDEEKGFEWEVEVLRATTLSSVLKQTIS